LTTTPNALTLPVHDRMPVILDSEAYDLWLDPGMQNVAAASDLLKPCVHSAASRNSHKDQMVWGGLRFNETPLSIVEGAFPELRDND
jgi:putative SOS response-associated peptidase YedK